MRRRILSSVVLVLLCSLVPAAPAGAIYGGLPDSDHPNVGTMVWVVYPDWEPNEGPFWDWYCTGSLLAPDLYLTAAHCVSPMVGWIDRGILHRDEVYVTFDADLNMDPDTGLIAPNQANLVHVASWEIDPRFRCNSNTCYYDMAVLHLATTVDIEPIDLPTENFLGEQAAHNGLRGHAFVNVGYGSFAVDRSFLSPNATIAYPGYRQVATSPFMALSKTHLYLLMNSTATGQGGTGFGDSGGPKFFGEIGSEYQNLVVALDTSGDPATQALGMCWRLDTPAARVFLGNYVELP